MRELLGPPRRREGFTQRWCIEGGSSLRVHFHKRARGHERGAPRGAALIRTTNPGHAFAGIGPGAKRARAIERLGLERRFEVGRTGVFAAPAQPRRLLLAGTSRRAGALDRARRPESPAGRGALREAIRDAR